jgi:glycerol-3-phosphate O-acyltransferase
VHQDPETKGQIIDYLDKAKNVILQVPSSQELSVERGIAQELQRAAQQLAKSETTSANTGEKTYGD